MKQSQMESHDDRDARMGYHQIVLLASEIESTGVVASCKPSTMYPPLQRPLSYLRPRPHTSACAIVRERLA